MKYCSNIFCYVLQAMSPQSAQVLDDVRHSLEKEALELDRMNVQMSAGNRLLKEKEKYLHKLKSKAIAGVRSCSNYCSFHI